MDNAEHARRPHDPNEYTVNLNIGLDRKVLEFLKDSHALLTAIDRKVDHILSKEDQLMSQITEFAARANAKLAEVGANVDNISADQAKLAAEIAALKEIIANGDSTLTPEAQAALDSVDASAQALADKTKGVADAVPDVLVT